MWMSSLLWTPCSWHMPRNSSQQRSCVTTTFSRRPQEFGCVANAKQFEIPQGEAPNQASYFKTPEHAPSWLIIRCLIHRKVRLCWNLSWISKFPLVGLKGTAQGFALQSSISSHTPVPPLQYISSRAAVRPYTDTKPKLPQRQVISRWQRASLALLLVALFKKVTQRLWLDSLFWKIKMLIIDHPLLSVD